MLHTYLVQTDVSRQQMQRLGFDRLELAEHHGNILLLESQGQMLVQCIIDTLNPECPQELVPWSQLNSLQRTAIMRNIAQAAVPHSLELNPDHLRENLVKAKVWDWLQPDRSWQSLVHDAITKTGKEQPKVALAVDTSTHPPSSVINALWETFRQIVIDQNLDSLRVIQCDHRVLDDQTYRDDMPERASFIGGGGTSYPPVFHILEQDPPDLLFYFTDGYGDVERVETPAFPFSWLLAPHSAPRKPSTGGVIQMPLTAFDT